MSTIAHQRLYYQCIARQPFHTPAQVVEWLGAVQAQEYLPSLWAVGLRLPNAAEAAVEAAIADRSIVRTWPMRGTVHYVPARDAKWMLHHFTPKVISRTRSVYRNMGLDDDTLSRAGSLIEGALRDGKLHTREALYEALEAGGVATSKMRGMHIVVHWAQRGLICTGPRQGKQHTVILLDEWIPDSRMLPRDEAVSILAQRYFTSHGPATVHDFAWWSGATVAETKAALEGLGSVLAQETINGKTYWRSPETTAPPEPSPTVHLLPAFDEYLVSYKNRSASVDMSNTIIGSPDNHLGWVIVIDGQVVGNWKRVIKKNTVAISTSLVRPLADAEHHAFYHAAERYGAFLGLPVEVA